MAPADDSSSGGHDGGSGTGHNGSSGSSNPFIRFKDHVDQKIQRGYETWSAMLWSIPGSVDVEAWRPSSGETTTKSPPPPPCPPPDRAAREDKPLARPNFTPAVVVACHPNTGGDSGHKGAVVGSRGGADGSESPTDIDGVYHWAAHSPYSPFNLQHLRQPVPRGGRSHFYRFSFTFPPWDSSSSSTTSPSSSSDNPEYTFRDAFEDLLIASSGSPLPDLRGRLFRRMVDDMPRWDPAHCPASATQRGLHVADWTAQLGHDGLWHAYFALPPTRPQREADRDGRWSAGPLSPFSLDPWAVARRRFLAKNQDGGAAGAVGASSRDLRFLPLGIQTGKDWDWVWPSRDAFHDHSEEEPPKSMSGSGVGNGALPPTRRDSAPQESETEEDLYDFLAATDFSAAGADDAASEEPEDDSPPPPETVPSVATTDVTTARRSDADVDTVETTETSDGGKTVKTVRRRVDPAKNRVEHTTTVEHYDAAGDLVARSQTSQNSWHWPSSSSSSWFSSSASASGGVSNQVDGQQQQQQEGKRKGGWFWT